MKNASASGSSKSQMLLSLLPLPISFFKVLPLPQKFNHFLFPVFDCLFFQTGSNIYAFYRHICAQEEG